MSEHLSYEESLKAYLKIFAGLMVFTAITVIAAKWEGLNHFIHETWPGPLGGSINVTIGLIIATIKVAMVVWIFMHIKFDNPLIRICIGIPLFLFGFMIFAFMVLESWNRVRVD